MKTSGVIAEILRCLKNKRAARGAEHSSIVNSYRHRSPGVVTYVFQRYPNGSTSGTITTPGKMPKNESAMPGSSV
jgi:hypothetical protein